MNRFQIGIVAESTGLPIRAAIEQASKWAVDGLQADGVGALAASELGDTGRREFKNLLRSFNLELAAIGCPLRRGLDSPEDQQKRLENIRNAMQLAYDLGARKVVVPFPKLPEPESAAANTLRESLLALAAHGDRVGTVVCLEVGLDDAASVKDYLAAYDTGALAVNFDPANFLVNGHDPLKAAMTLTGRIGHTHARDARRSTAHAIPEEVPVGAGDIEWLAYIATLEAIDYRGYLTIERTVGERRLDDLAASVRFLRRFAPRNGK
ncbi:MAG: sugar phosphate isomerase/epimerase [Gemmataceae bacterium]|nr:sugar phosphate isomerase/epimerase [Gemmataceae bacterium]